MYYSLYTLFSHVQYNRYLRPFPPIYYMSVSHIFQYNTASLHMGYNSYVHHYMYTRPFLLFLLSTRVLYCISIFPCVYVTAVESLQSHFILTMSHWSSELPVCIPPWGTQVLSPAGYLFETESLLLTLSRYTAVYPGAPVFFILLFIYYISYTMFSLSLMDKLTLYLST
jgi:hypothetical protein